MKLIILSLMMSVSSVSDLRKVYESQDEDKVMNRLSQLEAKTSLSQDELCYKAVFMCLKAKYVSNPYTKLTSFNSGYDLLEKTINKNPKNVEYRFHRYMIETNAPAWLIDESHIVADKEFIKENVTGSNPLYHLISMVIK
jgi:hypothetical protein